MRTTPVDRLAHIGRVLLLLGALLGAATLGAWKLAPEWVDSLDDQWVEAHMAAAEALDEELRATEPGDSEALLAIAARQAALLERVRPGERMDEHRRRALEYMTRHRERLGDLEGARESARAWVASDPRNARAVLELGRLLIADSDARAEGIEVLGQLFLRMPEVDMVAEAWCNVLMDEGRFVEAAEAALHCDRQARPNLWRIRWRRRDEAPKPFQAVLFPELDADGRLVVEGQVAGPISWLSLELPPGGRCTLIDPVLTFELKGKTHEVVLADAEGVLTPQLARSGRAFVQDGGLGARFELDLGTEALDPEPTVRLNAGIVRPPSAGLLAVAYHPRLEEALRAVRAAGRDDLVGALGSARLAGLVEGEVQLYWRKRKGGFTRANSVIARLGGTIDAGALNFDLELPIAERVSLVRLDLPEGTGVAYDLEHVDVVGAEGTRELDAGTLELELMHGVERDGSVFTVTGSDPWLAFELPGEVVVVDHLRVAGVAR